MKNTLIYFLFAGIFICMYSSCTEEKSELPLENTSIEKPVRIISLSGFLTEVLSELGHFDKIVGRDVTSTCPAEAATIPNLGHLSQLNVEALLELKPDFVFVESKQLGQSDVFQQLEGAGIKIVGISTAPFFNNSIRAAAEIGKHLASDEVKVKRIKTQIDADSSKLSKLLTKVTKQPKVLFIYARGTGRLMVAGKNTSAAAIIEKAGGENAIQSFDDFRAMSAEALLEAAPDVILMFTTGLESLDGKEGLRQITGIPQTPAFKNDKILAMDGHYLTAFGTRSGQAALELAEFIHAK
jgi:iron complex transport system substrate-binding protein